ncbi:uncharacterized protein [Choristoneura fumiferana]|uniref:uncharacterized protein n=1 Tax=Choristoneura fumiferana TaxID=7141 RepID=UPI003D1598CD
MADVEKNLLDYLQNIAKENGYNHAKIEIEAISSGGANYTSALYLATLSEQPKQDIKLFVKVANISESFRDATGGQFTAVYEMERFFYAEIAVAFEKLYTKHGVPEKNRLYIPKFYGFKSIKMEETLVLENLAANGFGNFNRFKTFNWDYASKSIEELAKFHALGLTYRKESPEEFEKIQKTAFSFESTEMENKMKEVFMTQAIKTGTQLIKEEYKPIMQKYLEKNDLMEQLSKLWMPLEGGALIHGDYRPSNLMHRRRNGKIEVVPLDYQTYRSGLLATDLMYFIFSGSDAQFRKYYYKQLLEHYYTELTRALKDLHVDINDVYPRKVFEHELDEAKHLGIFLGLTMMSLLTVDPENAPKFEDFDSLVVEPNQHTIDRLNGIVGDYIRWGIII